MAFLPKGALDSKRTAQLAVAASVIGLAVVPIIAVPAMFIGGITWHSAPRWARMTLIVGAVLFLAYIVAFKPAGQVAHHG